MSRNASTDFLTGTKLWPRRNIHISGLAGYQICIDSNIGLQKAFDVTRNLYGDKNSLRFELSLITTGIAQIADILQRIPTHVLEQYKDAAKHGFSRLVYTGLTGCTILFIFNILEEF